MNFFVRYHFFNRIYQQSTNNTPTLTKPGIGRENKKSDTGAGIEPTAEQPNRNPEASKHLWRLATPPKYNISSKFPL